MLKRYKAKSCLALNIVLPTGGNTHISFSPLTGGGSVYYTNNEAIQKGLERHVKFGKLFVLDSVQSKEEEKAPKTESTPEVKLAKNKTSIKMACNDDAKDYFADKFGVSRSKMRSRADIEKIASANGITIIWG
jgi:hypothetical protein